jgi:phosphoribosylformylglycinamidine synthase
MGIEGIERIEEFIPTEGENPPHDAMLERAYRGLDQTIFFNDKEPEPIIDIEDIAGYNKQEGLALNEEEIEYLQGVSKELGRSLTDSEVFGFSQVNSEHCRHKIFNGDFVIDGQKKPATLFQLIRKTSNQNPNKLVSAYKDNVAFVEGPRAEQFAPVTQDKADFFVTKNFDSVISLKAETHNFPTTVEPFNGAATGSGGEIRDRMAGGKASFPLAGTAVYMTSYPRTAGMREWEHQPGERAWLYQTPLEILIKASNGASDFGNKFGQPLISGSVLTFEHEEGGQTLGFDKVIMLAGGIGYGKKRDSLKDDPGSGDDIVVLGGDNYRIGMGGGAVSSVATGEFSNTIELNAIQRSNPEMQKRVANAVRAMGELDENPIISIHDHGAGGHLNCLSELVETTGGTIEVSKLPVGDHTLSEKEIIGNESQERMGLVINPRHTGLLRKVAERERAPLYQVGKTTGDMRFKFVGKSGRNPIDWGLMHMFGSSPVTILEDNTQAVAYAEPAYNPEDLERYIKLVLQIEAVACKDWLTNKVDRSVTGKVAKQQTCGQIQLPLNNVGVMAMDYRNQAGIATAIGHSPVATLIDAKAGSKMAISEALTNIIWAPIKDGLAGISLSANWMWPCKNEGEDARLYDAVEAVSDFACDLGINIPTGKDSLSMMQKYPDGKRVKAPGTVIISAAGEVTDINQVVEPALKPIPNSQLLYINFSDRSFNLGGSSFYQVLNTVGKAVPATVEAERFKNTFNLVQELISAGQVLAGHDISAGGMITTLLEMAFPTPGTGFAINLNELGSDLIKLLFSEQPGVIIQVEGEVIMDQLLAAKIDCFSLGTVTMERTAAIVCNGKTTLLNIDELRDTWFRTSYLLDVEQSGAALAKERFENYPKQPLSYQFPTDFTGTMKLLELTPDRKPSGIKAAIIREKGVNGDREMAYALYLAGFDVKDVHMTDLTSGRETLTDISLIVFVGGFSNSDVLGSAKGWAGAFRYNELAKATLAGFYARPDTLSLGVCNGCQLMMELELLYPGMTNHPKLHHNSSGKFESGFVNMSIPENESIMFKHMAGERLGVWVAHGEGRFDFSGIDTSEINITGTYSYEQYPGNPNGSALSVAALSSPDGRHLAMMPHLERSIFPWQWPYYPANRRQDEVTPWIQAFISARNWIVSHASED